MTFKVGDRVSIDHPNYPGIWVIKKLAPVNATLENADTGRPLKAPRTMLIEPSNVRVDLAPMHEYYSMGELVRISAGKFSGLYVVLDDRGEKLRLVRLGGDNNRYLRVTKRGLTRVPVDEILRDGVTV